MEIQKYITEQVRKQLLKESKQTNGIDTNFAKLIVKLQNLNKKHGFDYPECCMDEVNKIGKEIQTKQLLKKCEDTTFAKQLLMKNDVPRIYWKD